MDLLPLWMQQIPNTVMNFTCVERTLDLFYKYVSPKPRQNCTNGEKVVVAVAAGCIVGVCTQKLGWAGLVMAGIVTASQWFNYDAIKDYLRMPHTATRNARIHE